MPIKTIINFTAIPIKDAIKTFTFHLHKMLRKRVNGSWQHKNIVNILKHIVAYTGNTSGIVTLRKTSKCCFNNPNRHRNITNILIFASLYFMRFDAVDAVGVKINQIHKKNSAIKWVMFTLAIVANVTAADLRQTLRALGLVCRIVERKF